MFDQFARNLNFEFATPEVLVGVLVFVVFMFVGTGILAIYYQRRKATSRRGTP